MKDRREREKAKELREARRKRDGDWSNKREGAAQTEEEKARERRDWLKKDDDGERKDD